MRTIGNIERFLVLGIVVVIGAILTVAITGARDLEQNAANGEAAAKTGPGKSGTPLKQDVPKSGGNAAAKDRAQRPRSDAAGAPVRPQVDPRVDDLVKKQRDALEGRELAGGAAPNGMPKADDPPAPVAPGNDNAGVKPEEKAAVIDAPEVVDDLRRDSRTTPDLDELFPIPIKTPDPGPVAPSAPVAAKQYVYVVQKGDSLERIARALYGDGQLWKDVLAANPDVSDAHTIRAGDRLKLPRAPTQPSEAVLSDPIAPGGTTAGSTKTAASESAAPAAFKRVSSENEYRVQKGDTLMSIAAAKYGTKAAWRVIYDANSALIPDKDRIKTGILLKLPAN